jgi:hypothetical protein
MEETSDGTAFDAPMQARTPGRDIFGKLDDNLPEVRIPFEVKQEAERAARAADCGDLTTWLRELVYASLYGPEHIASLYAQRAKRVLGNARRSGNEEG